MLTAAAGRGASLIAMLPVLRPLPVPIAPPRDSGQGGSALSSETRASATAGAQGSGVDVLVAARDDRVNDGLLLPADPLFSGMANDVLSGMDLAGSLLTGGRPVPNLVARRGTSLAPVATVSDSVEGSPAESALPAQEMPWIDFVIGLDDTILPRYPALTEPDSPAGEEGELDPISQAAVEEEDFPNAAGVSRADLEGARGPATEWVLALSAVLLVPGVLPPAPPARGRPLAPV
jgi:hypothetical protein